MKAVFVALLFVLAVRALPAKAAPDFEPALDSVASAWMPQARSNMAVVEWNDRVWCFGGNGLDGATATAWEFNPYTRRFQDLPPMSQTRIGHAAAVCGRQILVFGGMHDKTVLDSIEAFDPDKRTWSSAGRMPAARARFGLAVVDGRVYVIGGTDGAKISAEVWALDPKKGTWERKADLPDARDRLAAATLDGAIYAMGGETAEGKGSAICWRYDPAADKWTKIASLSAARRNLCASRLGGALIVAGGWNIVDDEKVFLPRIEVYDPKHRDWVPQGRLESQRDGCRSSPWRGRLFIFGGFGGETLSSVEECQWQTARSGWVVDEPMKFHLATYATQDVAEGPHVETARPVGSPAGADVTNIGLAAFRALGFPLAARPDEAGLTFFLKFFEYPVALTQEASVRRATAAWPLRGMHASETVVSLIKSPTGVVIKKGLIDKTGTVFNAVHPFPPLRVMTEEVNGVMPQDAFDETILFSSLYVRPAAHVAGRAPGAPPRQGPPPMTPASVADGDARASAGGVLAFLPEELALLGRAYRAVNGPDARYDWFADDTEADQAGDAPRTTLIRVARAPTIFDNWRELPMPQDPAHMFLGSLLLSFADDYRGSGSADELSKTKPFRSLVFEVASVVRAK